MMNPSQADQLPELFQKQLKTPEDVHLIYEKIRYLTFLENLFTETQRTIDLDTILNFCQDFKYEKFSIGDLMFQYGDSSDEKFYIIISGQVNVVIPAEEHRIAYKATLSSLRQKTLRTLDLDSKNLTETNKLSRNKSSPKRNIQKSQIDGEIESKNSSTVQILTSKKTLMKRAAGTLELSCREKSPESKRMFRKIGNLLKAAAAMKTAGIESAESKLGQDSAVEIKEETKSTTSMKDDKIIEEPQEELNLNDPRIFDKYASRYGSIERSLYKGDCFGDVEGAEFKSSCVSVVCRTSCEFLVGTRQQFENLFRKRNLQKEVFFKEFFPFLRTAFIARPYLLDFLSLFKIETYNKGNFLTVEGKSDQTVARIFFISKGECLVEKPLQTDKNSQLEPNTKSPQPIVIGLVGSGMVVGEEVLTESNEYSYNVKALTETVQVYTITKQNFEEKCIKEFQDHILGVYERRKKQRESITKNAQKEYETQMSVRVDAMRNTQSKFLLHKSTIQISNAQAQQEQEALEVFDSLYNNFFTPTSPVSTLEKILPSPSPSTKTLLESELYDIEEVSPVRTTTNLKEKRRLVKPINFLNPQRETKYLASKLAFLSQFPEPASPNKEPAEIKQPEDLKLFPDPRRKKHAKTLQTTQPVSPGNRPYPTKKDSRLSVDVILKGLNKKSQRKFKFLSPDKMSAKLSSLAQDKATLREDNPKFLPNGVQVSFRDTALLTATSFRPNSQRTQKFANKLQQLTVPTQTMQRYNFSTQPGSPNDTISFHNLQLNSMGSLDNSHENTNHGDLSPLQQNSIGLGHMLVVDTIENDTSSSNQSPKARSLYSNSPELPALLKSNIQARKQRFHRKSKGSPKSCQLPLTAYKIAITEVVIQD